MRFRTMATTFLLAYCVQAPASQLYTPVQTTDEIDRVQVRLDATALKQIAIGQTLTVTVPGKGEFTYLVDEKIPAIEVTEIEAHLQGDVNRKLTIGIRTEGVTALVSTPAGLYSVGYIDSTQWFGPAGVDNPTDDFSGQPLLLVERVPAVGEQPVILGALPVRVELSAISRLDKGDTAILKLPDLGALRVEYDGTQAADDSAVWTGHLRDFGDNYKVLLTYTPTGTEGLILTPEGEVQLRQNAQGQLYAFNPTALGYRNAMGSNDSCARLQTPPTSAKGVTTATTSSVQATTTGGATGQQSIDALIYYTPGMITAYGSLAAVQAHVDYLLTLANQAYSAGGLAYQVRRAGLQLANIPDTTTNSSILDQMQHRTGVFANLDAQRAAAGADLVTTIRPFYNAAQGGNCGVGYIGGYGGAPISTYESLALSIVSDGVDKAGTGYYCDDVTLAHEMGHNMGLMHDRATVTSQGGGSGSYPYAYGYAVTGRWGTIMSYTFPHQIKFSNPLDLTCPGNVACGVPASNTQNSADNVRALAGTLPLVANFRTLPAGTPTFYNLTGIVSVNGAATAGVGFNIKVTTGADPTQVTCLASGFNGVYSCKAPQGFSFSLTPIYSSAPAGSTIAWTPSTINVSNINANQVVNLSGSMTLPSYSVSGSLTLDGKPSGTTSIAVSVPAGTDATKVACTLVATAGTYSCKAPMGYSFTLTPKTTASYVTWTPPSFSVSSLKASQTANFAGMTVLPSYVVSGSLTLDGKPSGTTSIVVSVPAGTDATKVACTLVATAGTYSCKAPMGYSFTLTPKTTASNVIWSQPSQTITGLSANMVVNFIGQTVSMARFTATVTTTINGQVYTQAPPQVFFVSGPDMTKVTCTWAGQSAQCSGPAATTLLFKPYHGIAVPAGKTLSFNQNSAQVLLNSNLSVTFAGTLK